MKLRTQRSLADVRNAVRTYVEIWDRARSHGLSDRILAALPLYRFTGIAESQDPEAWFLDVGWRVFLRSRHGTGLHALDIIRDPARGDACRLLTGELVAFWLRQIRNAGRRSAVRGKQREMRICEFPLVHLSLLWFADKKPGASGDLFCTLKSSPELAKPAAWITFDDLRQLARERIFAAVARTEQVRKLQTRRGG